MSRGPADQPDADTLARRWAVACHESSHVICALALGVPVRAAVLIDGGGLCYHEGDALLLDSAIIAAAGETGEQLAERFDAPKLSNPPAAPAMLYRHPDQVGAFAADLRSPPDWCAVRNFACSVPDSERWHPRAVWVRHAAAGIVADHAGQVLRVARELFRVGFITNERLRVLLRRRPQSESPTSLERK